MSSEKPGQGRAQRDWPFPLNRMSGAFDTHRARVGLNLSKRLGFGYDAVRDINPREIYGY